MWHLGSPAASLLASFKDALRFLVQRQQTIAPNPSEVVETQVTSQEVARALSGSGAGNLLGPAAEAIMRKIGRLIEHEPYLWHGFGRPDLESEHWELRVPASIRDFRTVTSVEDYVERVEQLIAPTELPPQPLSAAPLDIPYAVSFVDAVWENKTGYPLFARPEPASIARLTQPCDDEGSFNSHMSALADVLSQAAKPGTGKAPRAGALEAIGKYLDGQLDEAAAARCSDAIRVLMKLRTIRHGLEHGDARAKAVTAYADLGLTFPVLNWVEAWNRIAATTCGALDTLREEAQAGLGRE
jgi:hypothetical protein